jgi:uncharacterized membrane protein (DUF4010 family)
LTLHFSRMARREPDATPVLATGILLACGTMCLRMLLVAGLINAQLLQRLWVPAVVMAALNLRHGVMLLVVFRRKRRDTGGCTPGKPAGAKGGAQLRCPAHGDHDFG